MTVNKELLQLTIKTIKENPEHWNQEYWHCGTSHCFAGFAELIFNNIPINTDEEDLIEKYKLGTFEGFSTFWQTIKNARQILGLTEYDADVLFDKNNTLKHLEEYVDYLIEFGSLEDCLYH